MKRTTHRLMPRVNKKARAVSREGVSRLKPGSVDKYKGYVDNREERVNNLDVGQERY